MFIFDFYCHICDVNVCCEGKKVSVRTIYRMNDKVTVYFPLHFIYC